MRHNFVSVVVLALWAAGCSDAAAQLSVRYPAPDVQILVNGSPQRRYLHEGRWYVEAIKGQEYAIRLRNTYPVRVAVALSVDGLNTIDARHTDAASARKWVLAPYETITISGWQTSRTDARLFEFTTEQNSYGQALGKTADLGVISAVFFKERVSAVVRNHSPEASERNRAAAPPQAQMPAAGQSVGDAAALARPEAKEDYAATGMGRRTDHAITEVWMDLEDTPSQALNAMSTDPNSCGWEFCQRPGRPIRSTVASAREDSNQDSVQCLD
jgi:hypothetical protein